MTKNKRLSPEEQAEVVAEVKAGEMLKKDIAAKHDIHPTMISKYVQRAAVASKSSKVKSPKRRTAKKAVKANNGAKPVKNGMPTEAEWEAAYEDYIAKRNAAQQAKLKVIEIAKAL